MLAFTFPGQGSQRPGMGRAWVDHPSWEVVDEASAIAGRDVARLLLDADQDELTLTANAQLATFVLSLVVLDAIERVGIEPTVCAGHSLGEYTALAASGALGLRGRGPAGGRAGRGHARRGRGAPRDDGGGARRRRRRRRGRLPARRGRRLGGQLQRPRPGRHRRRPPRPWPAPATIAKELGARKVMPFPVAGAFHTPLMAPARARLRKALAEHAVQRARGARGRQRRRPGPHRGRGLAGAALGPAVQPGPLAPEPRDPRRHGDDGRSSRSGPAACSPAWPGAPCPTRGPWRWPRPTTSTRWWTPSPGARPGTPSPPPTKASTSTPPSGWSSRPRPASSSPSPASARAGPGNGGPGADGGRRAGRDPARARPVAVGDLLGTVGTAEVRTPFAGTGRGLPRPPRRTGRRPGEPVAWLRVPGRADAVSPAGAVITGWGTRPAPTPSSPTRDLEARLDTTDEWIVERSGIRERRIGGTVGVARHRGRPGRARRGPASAPGDDRPARAGHHHARPGRAGHLGRGPPRPRASRRRLRRQRRLRRASSTRWSWPTARSPPGHDRVLVIGADCLSRITDPDDRATAVLFADGAGAVVLEATDARRRLLAVRPRRRRQRPRPAHLRARRHHADGGQRGLPARRAHHRRLGHRAPWSGPSSRPTTSPCSSPTRPTCASSRPPPRASGIPMDRTAVVARPHRQHLDGVRSRWRWPRRPTPAGSRPGDLVLLSGFGAGMTWASAVLRWAGPGGMTRCPARPAPEPRP